MIAEGSDPSEVKRAKKALPDATQTFEVIARRWHAANKQWSEQHSAKVLKNLEMYLFPVNGTRDIASLRTPDLLIPIRVAENAGFLEVSARLLQRTTAIMRYAVQCGIIDYNPAQDMVGALTTVKRVHRPALELNRIPELLSRIEGYKGQPLTRLAVMLNLFVFIRSSELRYARWSEIDTERALWTIPAEREPIPGVKFSHRGSKMRTTHLVPLRVKYCAKVDQGIGELWCKSAPLIIDKLSVFTEISLDAVHGKPYLKSEGFLLNRGSLRGP